MGEVKCILLHEAAELLESGVDVKMEIDYRMLVLKY